MKAFTIAAVSLLAAFAHGAPNPAQVHLRASPAAAGTATITFEGATPEATFVQEFPVDGKVEKISNQLSISHIKNGDPDASCTFYGIDGSVTTVKGAKTEDVGPPQTQTSGVCHPLPKEGSHITIISHIFL